MQNILESVKNCQNLGESRAHCKLRANSARNSQLLRQIDVGTVNILFDRATSLFVADTCTT